MSKVFSALSVSVDGYITGRDPSIGPTSRPATVTDGHYRPTVKIHHERNER